MSSDARKEAGEKILPQGVYGRARPSGGRNLSTLFSSDVVKKAPKARVNSRAIFLLPNKKVCAGNLFPLSAFLVTNAHT